MITTVIYLSCVKMFGCVLLMLNVVLQPEPNLVVDVVRNPQPVGAAPILTTTPSLPVLTMDMMPLETPLPEMEKFTVELKKDYHGLGITIAGYVCEKGESALLKT
jgi:multiple PDZ domain protein